MTARRIDKGRKAKRVTAPAPIKRNIRGDVLGWLLGRRSISPAQHAAGVIVRGLWSASRGPVNTNRFAERIDAGHGNGEEARRNGTIAADRRLRNLVAASDIGVEAVEVVIRVCGQGESLAAIALAFERDPKQRASGRASSTTLAEVSRLLRNGLGGIANVVHGKPARGDRVRSYAVLSWLAADARPKLSEDEK